MAASKVSIITPVYKAETTIRKCLDSFLAQTLQDWEQILVDDGSPDNSGQICDEYAKRDSRFRVIHQQNAGVSAARQVGLEAATGEYVIHADPDDWVEPGMLEELYAKAKEDDADMVICDYLADFADHSDYRKQCPSSLDAETVLNEMFGCIHGSCCNKLVRRSCIERCGARFPKGINYCEDVCFNVQLLIHDIKVTYLNKAYYHYVQVTSSLTNHYTLATLNTQKRYVDFLRTHLPEDSYPVLFSKEFVKKQAFRYGVLNDKEFSALYPEIKEPHGDNPLVSIMYHLAFKGYYGMARIVRFVYYKSLQIRGIKID